MVEKRFQIQDFAKLLVKVVVLVRSFPPLLSVVCGHHTIQVERFTKLRPWHLAISFVEY